MRDSTRKIALKETTSNDVERSAHAQLAHTVVCVA
jgi:hypothetical protein